MQSRELELSMLDPAVRKLVEEAVRVGEIQLTNAGKVVARIVPARDEPCPRVPGSARGQIHMAADFDEMPEDFREFF